MLLNRRPGPRAIAHGSADDRITRAASRVNGFRMLTLVPRVSDKDAGVFRGAGSVCRSAAAYPIRVCVGIEPRGPARSHCVAGDQGVAGAALGGCQTAG